MMFCCCWVLARQPGPPLKRPALRYERRDDDPQRDYAVTSKEGIAGLVGSGLKSENLKRLGTLEASTLLSVRDCGAVALSAAKAADDLAVQAHSSCVPRPGGWRARN
ncbi:hypothetical protein Tco_1162937 [Tanacetum coccineum]